MDKTEICDILEANVEYSDSKFDELGSRMDSLFKDIDYKICEYEKKVDELGDRVDKYFEGLVDLVEILIKREGK
ncbi:hypothetical protein [Candidatus Contubernalis alkaliaceticus]|uniref:hypothetical protein n=1 Tax=Candidatus Contubernalis alkaliaceticus TaxID=338645 RepID=UPI001F4BEBE4|nr:hypothetical protein [Candidatus Contubernalis alkalaceticus]UNC92726.1 hypothetical protein HUE98_11835 [Candidatus Contubernalis alkalaceticus]